MKTTGHVGIPSSELIMTVPLWPGLKVLTVPLELNSRVRVAPFCAASDPQELGGTSIPVPVRAIGIEGDILDLRPVGQLSLDQGSVIGQHGSGVAGTVREVQFDHAVVC